MAKHWTHISFAATNAICLPRLQCLLAIWLPDGRLVGREWVALNPKRNDRRAGSFKVNVATGQWADFATGDRGGDPVSLYAYLNDLSQKLASLELYKDLGGN